MSSSFVVVLPAKPTRGPDFNWVVDLHRTVDTDLICTDLEEEPVDGNVTMTRVHDNGWSIEGVLSTDYFTNCTEFVATHAVHGKVWADFDDEMDIVYATSQFAYEQFIVDFPDWESETCFGDL